MEIDIINNQQVLRFYHKRTNDTNKVHTASVIMPITIRSTAGDTSDFELSELNSLSYTDGAWVFFIFDSTSNNNRPQFTVIQDPG